MAPSPDELIFDLVVAVHERSLRIGFGNFDRGEVIEGVTKLEDAGRGANDVHGSEFLGHHLGVVNSDLLEGHGRW